MKMSKALRAMMRSYHTILACTAAWAVFLTISSAVWVFRVSPVTLLLVPVQALAGVGFGWSWHSWLTTWRSVVPGFMPWEVGRMDGFILGGEDGHTPVPANWMECMEWMSTHTEDRRV